MTKEDILIKLTFDLELRNRTRETIRDYEMHVRLFQDYFDKPADKMREAEIANFLHYLLTQKKNTPATVNTYNSAIRFLYCETLDIVLNIRKIPRIKENRKIPNLPTKTELAYLFYLTENIKYKAIFMVIYGSGLRLSEAANLKITDIDSENMRIFIRSGKGNRDRYALLPEKSLDILRQYFRKCRPKGEFLFITKGKLRKPQLNQLMQRETWFSDFA